MKNSMSQFLLRSLLVATVAVGAVILSGCGSSNAATATPIATTAVLVHGAFADGSSWAKITPLLQQRGVKVVSVQLQRKSIAEDAAIVQRAIQAQSGQVVLVGHSYGGAVITEAGLDGKVAALVYVSAFAPGDGESIADLTSPYPVGAWQSGLAPDSAGYLSLNPEAFVTYFAPDLPRGDANILATSQGPLFNHALQDKLTAAAWKTKPSWWIVSGADQIIPPAFQQAEAARLKAKVTVVDGSSHVVMLSHPAEVAAVILNAVSSVGG